MSLWCKRVGRAVFQMSEGELEAATNQLLEIVNRRLGYRLRMVLTGSPWRSRGVRPERRRA